MNEVNREIHQQVDSLPFFLLVNMIFFWSNYVVRELKDPIDVAIIGAGPAGMSAALHAAKLKLSHILFERREVGNTIYDYQLRKHVMAEPNRLPLRAELPFEAGTREVVLERWNEALKKNSVVIQKAEVTSVKKKGEFFEVTSKAGVISAKHIIMAIGMQGSPRKLDVPGEELSHVAYTLSDPDAWSEKNILVVGAGDAAIENALALCEKNNVSILNRADDFSRAKEANANKILEAIENSKIRMYANSKMAKIREGFCDIQTPEGEVSLKCDHLIARVGGTFPRKFLEDCGIEFASSDPSASPRVNSRYESNVSGLFILGALIGYPLIKQAINQGFEVIEMIAGREVEPADQKLIEEALQILPGKVSQNLEMIQSALPLFKDLSEAQFRELILESKLREFSPGELIFERNDYTDTFFSIISGGAKVEVSATRYVSIEKGRYFGEMGLLSGRRRVATVKAMERSLLLESPRKQILKLMKSVPSVKDAIDRMFMFRALQSSVFPEVEAHFLQNLVERAQLKSFKKNEDLFREGDIGRSLYVIRKGSVKISRRNSQGANVTQTYVAAGNVVGEMALLQTEDTPRSATATAAVASELIIIEKKDFQEILSASPEVRARLEQMVSDRRLNNLRSEMGEEAGALLDFMMVEGVTDADNVLVIDSNLCIGCDNCEKACAATHEGASRLDRKGGKSLASIQIPISCRHCENPLCMTDCPPDALARQPNGEVIIKDNCIGCGNCVRNCPYGVIQLVHEHPKESFSLLKLLGLKANHAPAPDGPAKAAKCDLCSGLKGGPACVRSCPTGAAIRVNPKALLQMVRDGDEAI